MIEKGKVDYMKYLIALIIVLSALQLNAQDKSKIVFLRKTGEVGAAGEYSEFIDGKLYCKLDNKSYNKFEIDAGTHEVTWQGGNELKKAGKEIAITMDFKPCETYYFLMNIVKNGLSYEFYIFEITERSAVKLMAELKEDTNCK